MLNVVAAGEIENEAKVSTVLLIILSKQYFHLFSGPITAQVPQPVYVHTSPPQGWNSIPIQSPESRPMLPQPSAPPRPYDHFHMEHPPPPYEKLYNGK